MILYIHGFRSTPNSDKALLFKAHYGDRVVIADFSYEPEAAIVELEQIMAKNDITGMIASSLGGFYATYLSEKYAVKAVLINPSTKPYETLERYLGTNETHDGALFEWKKEHLVQLEQFAVKAPTTERYALFLQKGDEILDYRAAQRYYAGAETVLEEGGSHRFGGIERHFSRIDHFLAV